MKLKIGSSWAPILKEEFEKPYFLALRQFVLGEKSVYPPLPLLFEAFVQTPFEKVKVVIVGQDPYHTPGLAHGLCFSVPPGAPLPPSLRNIFLEMERDLGIAPSKQGCLLSWAQQGVFLLNTVLSVRPGEAQSHAGQGWEQFTDAVIAKLAQRADPLVFVLWGKAAQRKQALVGSHMVLAAPHPSPFSAHTGFLGCGHFSQINRLLEGWGKAPIDWRLSSCT